MYERAAEVRLFEFWSRNADRPVNEESELDRGTLDTPGGLPTIAALRVATGTSTLPVSAFLRGFAPLPKLIPGDWRIAVQRTTVQMPTSEIDRQSNESIVDEGLHLDKGGGVEELSGEASSGSSVYPTRHCVLAWSGKVKPRLLPRSLFLETARREQLRAIRTNAKVCMVLVSIDKALRECPDALFELSGRLQNHIRETDLLGWYAHNRLALLLLDTDEHAARECIDRIKLKETTEETGPSLEFQLLSYSESAFSLGESPWSKLDQPRFIDADPKLVPRSQLLVT